MDRNTKIVLAVAGGAGLAIYMVVRRQRQAQAAALMAASAGAPVPPPSFWEVVLGKVPETVVGLLDRAKGLEQTIAARGPEHLAAWKRAVGAGAPYYTAAKGCYRTTTGELVQNVYCPSTQLEGF